MKNQGQKVFQVCQAKNLFVQRQKQKQANAAEALRPQREERFGGEGE